MRKHVWIGLCISAVCLYFAFRGISFREIATALSQARWEPVGLAILIYLADFVLRSARWGILMRPISQQNAKTLFWPLCLGFFANYILPFRMGELLRAHVAGTKFNISRSSVLATIVVERICDLVSFLAIFVIGSLGTNFPAYMKKGAAMLGGACIGGIILLLLIHQHTDKFQRLLARIPGKGTWKSTFEKLILEFTTTTMMALKPRLLLIALPLSFVIWSLEATFLYLMGSAFNLPLTLGGAYFLLFALGLSVSVPQAPGYVGTFELFGVTALALLSIPKELALPMILAVHGMQYILLGICGTMALVKENLRFADLFKLRAQ